jgi:hypothetical protein
MPRSLAEVDPSGDPFNWSWVDDRGVRRLLLAICSCVAAFVNETTLMGRGDLGKRLRRPVAVRTRKFSLVDGAQIGQFFWREGTDRGRWRGPVTGSIAPDLTFHFRSTSPIAVPRPLSLEASDLLKLSFPTADVLRADSVPKCSVFADIQSGQTLYSLAIDRREFGFIATLGGWRLPSTSEPRSDPPAGPTPSSR